LSTDNFCYKYPSRLRREEGQISRFEEIPRELKRAKKVLVKKEES
jgi:hypothetical protein